MALPELLCERVFTTVDQDAFAALSGDRNPMHMDPVAARRTQAGSPVVHGVHAIAWALDAFVAKFGELGTPLRLNVRFDRFIYLDRPVEAVVAERGPAGWLIVLSVDGAKVASARGELQAEVPVDLGDSTSLAEPLLMKQARNLDLADLPGVEGLFQATSTSRSLAAAFPSLSREIGAGAVGSLLALSTLVGMHAPGLHSIFSKFMVTLTPAGETGPLSYRVTKVQPLLRAVEIAVVGLGLRGSVSCFVRRPPVVQPSMKALDVVGSTDCVGHRVLVVGGSRGLGEVTAKLCALGGADVTITYAVGSRDAEAVRDDIVAHGGRCDVSRLDVTEPVGAQLDSTQGQFTHVYYFATSQIFRQKAGTLSPAQLSRLLEIHLFGFGALCEALTGSLPVKVFYPSSVAIDEGATDAVEYVIAKTAGEILSRALNTTVPGLTVMVERLPRTDTDQTATVLPVKSAGAVDVISPIIKRMHASEGS